MNLKNPAGGNYLGGGRGLVEKLILRRGQHHIAEGTWVPKYWGSSCSPCSPSDAPSGGYCVALQVNHVIFFWKRFVYLWAVVKDQHPIKKRIESLCNL